MTVPVPLRILHLEDCEPDAALVRETILRAGLRADIRLVEDGPSFERALASEPTPDLILCDYTVPILRGPAILERARLLRPDTPVLFVSGAVGEQQAVELLRKGATDFVSKDNLDRLPLAIRRAMDEVRDRRLQRQAEERYRLTVESCPDALVTVSREGVVLEWNPQAERTFGWTRGEVVGRPLPDRIVPDRYRDAYAPALRRLAREGGAWRRLELSALRRDGKEIPVELTVWPLQGSAGWSAFVRDLSERKLLEEQFLQAQKMEVVGRLAGGAAHDFNNLLTVVLGYGDIVLGSLPAEDENHPRVAEMVAAAERAMMVTRQLLGFTRKRDVRVRSVDLNAVVAGLTRMLSRLVGEDIRIETQLAPEGAWVSGDPGQIEQVLVNLVVNARDAMPDGGRVAISTAEAGESVDATTGSETRRRGNFLRLTVSDTGAGMSPEVRARIFEPFFTTKPEGKGTGLGLSTVRSIVHGFGGAVDVETRPGAGSAFHVYLPKASAGTGSTRILPPQEPRGTAPARVLVVEDEEIVRRLTSEVMRQAGYRVDTAADGDEALRVLRERRDDVRLVLTDCVMPRMNGRELARRLREERPDLKVIFMSGYVDRGIEQADAAGGAFLEKPFTPQALLAKVREMLGEAPRS